MTAWLCAPIWELVVWGFVLVILGVGIGVILKRRGNHVDKSD